MRTPVIVYHPKRQTHKMVYCVKCGKTEMYRPYAEESRIKGLCNFCRTNGKC